MFPDPSLLRQTSGIQKACSEFKNAGASTVWGLWAVTGRISQGLCVWLTMTPMALQKRLSLPFCAEEEDHGLNTGWLDSRVTPWSLVIQGFRPSETNSRHGDSKSGAPCAPHCRGRCDGCAGRLSLSPQASSRGSRCYNLLLAAKETVKGHRENDLSQTLLLTLNTPLHLLPSQLPAPEPPSPVSTDQ